MLSDSGIYNKQNLVNDCISNGSIIAGCNDIYNIELDAITDSHANSY